MQNCGAGWVAGIEAYTPSTITDVQALHERVREDRAQGFSIVDEELSVVRADRGADRRRAGEAMPGSISARIPPERRATRCATGGRPSAVAEQVSASLA
jgi:DNA-binding IclR family transcriptional regulator